jgi:hypothetical protein
LGKTDESVVEESVTHKSMIDLKTVKLTENEQNFVKDYRKLEEMEREKGIKFFRCIGDEPHTKEFTDGVNEERSDLIENNLLVKRDCDVNRYKSEIDRDFVVVDTDI